MGLRGPKKGYKKLKQGEKASVTVQQPEPDFKLKVGQVMVQKEKKDEEVEIQVEKEEELAPGVQKRWNGKEWIKYDQSLLTLSEGVITKYFYEGKEVWIDRSQQVKTPIKQEGLLK